ncbi:MAG: hypothetical protein Dasosvirus3_9 [Dasosvirus sp.]|uniref:Uncharacterized protein n=1 Tax=Dasosvirus sp. TaxID=2487764 RepID=A0A3G4ZRB2_9VIRU|nr:MAG: hypothetical protein Dasosvirus3_9 [Dasosvirus sp.]
MSNEESTWEHEIPIVSYNLPTVNYSLSQFYQLPSPVSHNILNALQLSNIESIDIPYREEHKKCEQEQEIPQNEKKEINDQKKVAVYTKLLNLIPHCVYCSAKIPNKFFEPHIETNWVCNSIQCQEKTKSRFWAGDYCTVCSKEMLELREDHISHWYQKIACSDKCQKITIFMRENAKVAQKTLQSQLDELVDQIPTG